MSNGAIASRFRPGDTAVSDLHDSRPHAGRGRGFGGSTSHSNGLAGYASVYLTSEELASMSNFEFNAPPSIALLNATTSLPENFNTTLPIKVGDIVVSDDGRGTNVLSLTGADAAKFVVVGTELFLRTGTVLDYEAANTLSIDVRIDDATVGTNPDDAVSYSLAVVNLREASIAARHVFYNRSTSTEFGDGSGNPSTPSIPPLGTSSGQAASTAHYTNYFRGLNGWWSTCKVWGML